MKEIDEAQIMTWKEYKSKDTVKKGINVKYKENEGRVTMLMDVMIDAPITHCQAVFQETDLMATWNKEMKDVKAWAATTDLSGGWSGTMKFPFPMQDRFMRVTLVSYADKRCNGILNVSRSVPFNVTRWGGVDVPEVPKKHVEVQVYRAYDYFEKISETQTKYCGLGEMSLGVNLPDMVLNHMMKSFGYLQMAQMKEVAEGMKDSAAYMERLTGSNKALYEKIDALVA